MAKFLVSIILAALFFNQALSYSIDRDSFEYGDDSLEYRDDSPATSIVVYDANTNITNIINIIHSLIPNLQNLRSAVVQILPHVITFLDYQRHQLRNNVLITINSLRRAVQLIYNSVKRVWYSVIKCTMDYPIANIERLINKAEHHLYECDTTIQDIHDISKNATNIAGQAIMVYKTFVERIIECKESNANGSCFTEVAQNLRYPAIETAKRIMQLVKTVNQAIQSAPTKLATCFSKMYMESRIGLANIVGHISTCSANMMVLLPNSPFDD